MGKEKPKVGIKKELIGQMKSLLDFDPQTGVFTWKVTRNHLSRAGTVAGCNSSNGYIRIHILGRTYHAHRLAWIFQYNETSSLDIDHIDGNKKNNRIANLRLATRSQNNHNAPPNRKNTSGYRGVYFNKNAKKWMAMIIYKGERMYLGYHHTPELAAMAYQEASQKLLGEFSKPQLP
ncbi:HNH endonuclease [Erwinia aphidicola]|uniref:HNH endonuclease n=1 Tax=Erwinia aphidicola TaxID=68334 RepID=A0ABU8DL82_ERWAP